MRLSRKQLREAISLQMKKRIIESSKDPIDIDKDTKIDDAAPSRSISDLGLPSINIEDSDDRDEIEDMILDDEEMSHTESETDWNPMSSIKFPVPGDRPSFHDPRGRTPDQIRADVHGIADELESRIPKKPGKSKNQKEGEFIEELEKLLGKTGPLGPDDFHTDPEFGPLTPPFDTGLPDIPPTSMEDTVELDPNRFRKGPPNDDDPTSSLNEAIRRVIRREVRKRLQRM